MWRKTWLSLLLLGGGCLFAGTHVSVGIGIGGYPPPPPPPVVAYAPVCPAPGYVWVPGYWYPAGPRYVWVAGYWTRPPFPGARWVGPRYHKHKYYRGYWRR